METIRTVTSESLTLFFMMLILYSIVYMIDRNVNDFFINNSFIDKLEKGLSWLVGIAGVFTLTMTVLSVILPSSIAMRFATTIIEILAIAYGVSKFSKKFNKKEGSRE